MAISIKNNGSLSINSSGSLSMLGGGGGSIPDSSHLYSLLRRGINQTTTTNGVSETVIASWIDARGAGLNHPRFLPQGRWSGGGGSGRGCTINGDGSVLMRGDGSGMLATFMRAASDDGGNPLSSTTDGSWTIYARVFNQKDTIDGSYDGVDGTVFQLFQTVGGGSGGADTGNTVKLLGFSNPFAGSTWRLRVEQSAITQGTFGTQYVPNPSEYQTVVLRGSPAQGWTYRVSNSNNSGGSFAGSPNPSYGDGNSLSIGSVIYLGESNSSNSFPLAVSDFAVYNSYHDDSTATQVISYLETTP